MERPELPGPDEADEAPSSTDLPITMGEIVGGKFRVERLVARGGMGVVLEATHLELDERVALKLIRPSALGNAEILERFKHEARAAAKLKNEHIARVMDVGTHNGIPYMVLEYLEGVDLGTILARGQSISVRDAVDWTLQACEGLGEAHARGIVHRDVKPENLFVAQHLGRPSIKLLDFGVSKSSLGLKHDGAFSLGEDSSLRQTTGMLGTPLYMSPEQIRSSHTVDHRSDIWSLGAVLYELLTGRPPFFADSVSEVCKVILEEDAPRLEDGRPDVPSALAVAVNRCLTRDPAQRFQNVAELAHALLPFAHPRMHGSVERLTNLLREAGMTELHLPSLPPPRESIPSVVVIPRDAPVAGFEREAETVYASTLAEPPRKRRWAFLVVAGGIGLLAVLAIAFALASRKTDEPLPSPSVVAVLPERSAPITSPTPASVPSNTPTTRVEETAPTRRAQRTSKVAAPGAPSAKPPEAPRPPPEVDIRLQR
jgi:serine/threonine-protein kinase